MAMTNTLWEAIKLCLWDFRPHTIDAGELEASDIMPGERDKLDVLVEHIRRDAAWSKDSRRDARRGHEAYL
jgi:hypothetical protein